MVPKARSLSRKRRIAKRAACRSETGRFGSATHYYVRLFVENKSEPGAPRRSTTEAVGFETSGPPTPLTFATHTIHGEVLRLLGYITPNNTDLDEVQTVTIGGDPTGGTFTLTSAGQSVTGTATAELTVGSNQAVVSPGPGARWKKEKHLEGSFSLQYG